MPVAVPRVPGKGQVGKNKRHLLPEHQVPEHQAPEHQTLEPSWFRTDCGPAIAGAGPCFENRSGRYCDMPASSVTSVRPVCDTAVPAASQTRSGMFPDGHPRQQRESDFSHKIEDQNKVRDAVDDHADNPTRSEPGHENEKAP